MEEENNALLSHIYDDATAEDLNMNNLVCLNKLPERVDNPNFPRIPEPTPEIDPFKDLTQTKIDEDYTFDLDEEFMEKAKKA